MNTNLDAMVGGLTATNDIRDIKPLVDIPTGWAWLWWLLALVVLIVLGVMVWRWWRKRQQAIPPIPVIPPHVRARNKLTEALAYISDPNRFCTLVADALRVYLEERFDLHAPERTTEEFLVELQSSRELSVDQKGSLREFLQSCDLVKFARFEPSEVSLRELHDAAARLVDETQFDPVTAPSPRSPAPGASSASGPSPDSSGRVAADAAQPVDRST